MKIQHVAITLNFGYILMHPKQWAIHENVVNEPRPYFLLMIDNISLLKTQGGLYLKNYS